MKNQKLRNQINAKERRNALEKELGVDLSNLSVFSFSEEQVKNKNIENLIGLTQIPLGIAGPLVIHGEFAQGDFYLPLATTEGALVASVNRGCKALSQSKVSVLVENVGITRGPVFHVPSLNEAKLFCDWLIANSQKLDDIVQATSPHLHLKKIGSRMVGRNVYVRFYFDSYDAMGMNMATKATRDIALKIEKELGIKCISLAGNFDTDKKPSWLNFISGRGKRVWAEAVISQKTVKEVLKTTPLKIQEVVYRKCLLGSVMSGSLGFNGHYANIVAALFAATGQDLAHVAEGSLGVTTTEINGPDLYFSVYLPDLVIGTVGGGTSLPTQKTALSILGIPDPKLKEGQQVLKLTEIIGAAVLAGELSLIAALASNDLVKAHEKLGRGRK